MWNFCCSSERSKGDDSQTPSFPSSLPVPLEGAVGSNGAKQTDADRYEEAIAAKDLAALVSLLPSSEPIAKLPDYAHPWAEDPRTVGALAATQLAILASTPDEEECNHVRQAIREAGGIPALVDFLRSEQSDRVQTAVVALKFLLDDCADCAVAAHKHGVLELLVQQLNSPVGGMRTAAGTALRSMCLTQDEYRREFAKLGGIPLLVRQLSAPPDPALKHADVQLEAILNLQDVIEDMSGVVIEQFALQALDAGVQEKLLCLTASPDAEVQAAAQEVLGSLSSIMCR